MSGPYNTPNFALARTIDIATFTPDASPLVTPPAAADIYSDAPAQGEFGQLATGKTLFFQVANGAILDTAAVVTYAVWTRANVVGTGNQWTLGQAPTTALAYASVSAPFRGDVFVQVLALSTTLLAGSVTVCVASALPGENSTLLQIVQPSGGLLHMVVDSGNVTVAQPVATRLQATVSGPGTAGSPTGGVVSIQGVASGQTVPVSGTLTTVQPVATLLQTTVSGPGTAGSPTGGVVSIQGVASGQTVPVSGTLTTIQPVATLFQATVAGAGVPGTPTGGVLSVQGATGGTLIGTVIGPPQTDAFQRLRVGEPMAMFDASFLYDKGSLRFDELVAGGGASTGPGTTGLIQMTVTNNNDRIVRQTRRYIPYQPGRSCLLYVAGVLNASGLVANSLARIGLFDDSADKTYAGSATGGNGFFFEQNGPTLFAVKRSFVTGVQVDTPVVQSQWNLDPLDGTGPSKVVLDVAKMNLYWFDFEGPGAGTVRQGIIYNGQYIIAHQWNFTNTDASASHQTQTLPIRYELKATGVGGPFGMKQGNCSVQSEGGFNVRGKILAADRGIRPRTVGTSPTALLTFQLRKEQNRTTVIPKNIDFMTSETSAIVRCSLYYGCASNNQISLLGATFAGVSASSVEYDIIASGFTGGYLSDSCYLVTSTSGGGQRTTNFNMDEVAPARPSLRLTANIPGESDIFVVAAQTVSGTVAMYAAVQWQEY